MNQALRLLQNRPRSKAEVRQRLEKSLDDDSDKALVDQVVNSLSTAGHLDDDKFTQWLIESRQSYKHKGKYYIRQELKQLGVEVEIIDKHLAKSDQEDFLNSALEVLNKKSRRLRQESDRWKRRKKALAFLQRRGFDYQISRSAIDAWEEEA